jgi:hypothetical protein
VQPGHREEPPEPGSQSVRPNHRTAAGLAADVSTSADT